MLPNPLPEKRVRLREMLSDEYPVDEETFYKAFDKYCRGTAFIRVLGQPLWDSPESPDDLTCPQCQQVMEYVVGIGYERRPNFIDARPFFIGETFLYFFLCSRCLLLQVRPQG